MYIHTIKYYAAFKKQLRKMKDTGTLTFRYVNV